METRGGVAIAGPVRGEIRGPTRGTTGGPIRGAIRVGALALLPLLMPACRAPAPAATSAGMWALVHPPDVADARAPGGLWLLPEQPIERWHQSGRFETEAACDAARHRRIDDTIDAARRRLGAEAKFDVDVRRAVNACCIPAGATGDSQLVCRRDGAPVTPP